MGSVCGWKKEREERSLVCTVYDYWLEGYRQIFSPEMCGFTFCSFFFSPRFHQYNHRRRKKRTNFEGKSFSHNVEEGWMDASFRTRASAVWGWGENIKRWKREGYIFRGEMNFFLHTDSINNNMKCMNTFFAAVWFCVYVYYFCCHLCSSSSLSFTGLNVYHHAWSVHYASGIYSIP